MIDSRKFFSLKISNVCRHFVHFPQPADILYAVLKVLHITNYYILGARYAMAIIT